MRLTEIAQCLADAADELEFGPPVEYVYNPLRYARAAYDAYAAKYGAGPKEVILLGMNPGPFGMMQTGVPFGDVAMVRDWLGIEAPVFPPKRQHPARLVHGFECRRAEVSGSRLWGWARDRFGRPECFFERFFVLNYCPLAFLEASGRNRTPDKLRSSEKRRLLPACDEALRDAIRVLKPQYVVGVGAFAAERARAALEGLNVRIGGILHPSPASPTANQDWRRRAEDGLRALGIQLPS